MKLVAISGGIATGKTTALKILQDLGYATISCDELVLKAYNAKQDKIAQALGKKIAKNKKQDNQKLMHLFFTDSTVKQKLEQIIHPFVKYEVAKLVCYHFLTNKDVVYVEVPLFFELKLDKYIDTILIDCNEEMQRERLQTRDGSIVIEEKLKAQIKMQEKRKLARHIIKNEGTKEDLRKELQKIAITGTGLYEYVALLLFVIFFVYTS